MEKYPVVLYDGDCGFCNRSVAFVMKNDQTEKVRFAAIQSDFTHKLFEEKGWPKPDLSTFYLVLEGELYQKSTAALKVASFFKFPARLLVAIWIIPKFIRDAGYDFIAKRRQRLSKNYCFVPSAEQRSRFLN